MKFSQLHQTYVEECSYNEYQIKSEIICYITCPEEMFGYKNKCYQSCGHIFVYEYNLKEEEGKCVNLTFNLKNLSRDLFA